jgi:hypothetical protein
MLRSILFSILQQDESAFLHFQFEFRKFKHRNNSSEWPYDSLKTVLSSFANHPPTRPLYLIIDAMDESQEEDRRSIIQLVCRLCSAENSSVKVFLASRPVAELTHQIENYHNVIRLQDENKDDIQKFINSFLPDLKLTDQYRHEAANYIKAKAEGVFVWVQLVKAELLRMHEAGHNDTQIIDRLKYLPTELVKFYELMLDRLEKEGKDLDVTDGITIFKFVLFALRPLTVLELQHILAIQHVFAIPGDPNSQFNPSHPKFKENLFNDIEKRITYCGGNFVEITGTSFEKDITNT